MATENKEMGDIVKKCKILLLDIEGTTTSISFVKDKLFPYAEENVKQFLDSQWETADVKDAVTALRKLAIEDQEGSVKGVVAIPGEDASKEDQIEGLVKNVKWQMAADRKAGALKQLQGLIWKQGYDNGDIKGHVFDDVSAALEAWHSADGQKVYIYSSGSVQAQKLLFGQSLSGDLLKFIDGHFDTAVGGKQEAQSYKNIVEKISCPADEILFLTDIVKEAEAARAAGVHVALVSREGNAPLSDEATSSFPVLHSLAELAVSSKKRKPEPQEETPAAKVPKTDASEEVKTALDTASPKVAAAEPVPEKMEVDEAVAEEPKAAPVKEQVAAPVKEQVIVEEVTDSNEGSSTECVVDLEPVVDEESSEEKEKKTVPAQTGVKEVTANTEKVESVVEEQTPTAPAEVTEVEELTDEKPLPDAAELIEGVEPVVEEPDECAQMEELISEGETLVKECNQMLDKVNEVTNLDNITTVKPLLETVAEEAMETENTDSNDIVDSILDEELDREMKQCADIDLNTVTEMTDEKTDVAANGEKDASPADVIATDSVDVAETTVPEKVTESPVETKPDSEATDAVAPVAAEPTLDNANDSTKTESEKIETKKVESAPEAKENKPQNNVVEEVSTEKAAETVKVDNIEPEAVADEPKDASAKPQESTKLEPKVNGKATNGESETVINGDSKKDEELNARLSEEGTVANGKVNGANGNAVEEMGQGDSNKEEIKVKTVTEEPPRTDPVDQPTEA